MVSEFESGSHRRRTIKIGLRVRNPTSHLRVGQGSLGRPRQRASTLTVAEAETGGQTTDRQHRDRRFHSGTPAAT
eukprot:15087593-Heterocapsa_arctica.AAC.1